MNLYVGLKLFDKDNRKIEITKIIKKGTDTYYLFKDIEDNDFIRYGAIEQYFKEIVKSSN